MKLFLVFLSSLFLVFLGSVLNAQDVVSLAQNLQYQYTEFSLLQTSPTPAALETTKTRNVFQDFLEGQKDIWTSPFKVQPHDLLWVGPFLAATGILISKDVEINNSIDPSQETLDRSNKISTIGSAGVMVGTSGVVYLMGKISKNDHAAHTGFLGLMALLQTSIVVQSLKLASGRVRPDEGETSGNFWSGGNSFPSGHAASVWALAGVFTTQYPHNLWISLGFYSVATAVSISRVTSEHHFPSDVLVGSTVGYLIGRMVAKQHSRHAETSHLESLVPYIDHSGKKYGMEMAVRW